jgi:hypothetical protein
MAGVNARPMLDPEVRIAMHGLNYWRLRLSSRAMAAAQGQEQPGLQLKAAVYKETVEGDLQGAIALYKQIVSNTSVPRPIAAAALLGLGGCYEKLGQAEARTVYERLLAEYSDQAQEAAQARDRLAAISRTVRMSSRTTIPESRDGDQAGVATRSCRRTEEMAFTDRGVVWVVPSRAGPTRTRRESPQS